jgi:hypothetical protein
MTLMIQLVGGQYLPNVLPVRHFHPEKVLLVYTDGTSTQHRNLKTLLQAETIVEALKTDAYDIHSIRSQLDTELQHFLPQDHDRPTELLFNLTGGTKSMVLAAYEIAAQYNAPVFYLESESGRSRVYRYGWHNRQLDLQSQEQLPEYLSLRDILNLHLGPEGKDTWEEKGPNNTVGALFEQAIAQVLHDHGYEVMCGVKIYKEVDIDVMIRYQNQVGIMEAKTDGQVTKFDGIKQLSTAVRHLGTYTKQFLVVNGKPTESQEIIRDALRITPILLLRYQQGMSTLTAEDTGILLREVDNKMKAGMARP